MAKSQQLVKDHRAAYKRRLYADLVCCRLLLANRRAHNNVPMVKFYEGECTRLRRAIDGVRNVKVGARIHTTIASCRGDLCAEVRTWLI